MRPFTYRQFVRARQTGRPIRPDQLPTGILMGMVVVAAPVALNASWALKRGAGEVWTIAWATGVHDTWTDPFAWFAVAQLSFLLGMILLLGWLTRPLLRAASRRLKRWPWVRALLRWIARLLK